jgi:hypothetical protein
LSFFNNADKSMRVSMIRVVGSADRFTLYVRSRFGANLDVNVGRSFAMPIFLIILSPDATPTLNFTIKCKYRFSIVIALSGGTGKA